MEEYSIIVFLIYIGLILFIIPKSGFEFDIYKINIRLLPYWVKRISVIWIFLSLIWALLMFDKVENWNSYLISAINLALFVILFSKQKYEDEFSEQIRFISFTYSFLSFIALMGAFGVLDISSNNGIDILNKANIQILIGLSLIMSLFYFYISIYKYKKSN